MAFETDSQLLADALDLLKVDSSPYAVAIKDIKFQLKIWFSKQKVLVCRREANFIADALAKVGRICLSNNSCMCWTRMYRPKWLFVLQVICLCTVDL